jgi:exopolysaccharide production protein ExoZ
MVFDTSAASRIYTDPIILEFVLGMSIAANLHRLSAGVGTFLLGVGIVTLVAVELFEWQQFRLLTWGVPAVCIVAGAIALEMRRPIPKVG